MNRRLILVAAAALCAARLHAQAPAARAADALLDRLVGEWRMTGQVQGEPVTYAVTATRELGGGFVVLRLKDVAVPPQYEAHVYVGVDTAGTRVIAHWMDGFGAGASIPHGVGAVRGDTLVLTFAYASGDFRDTFTYDRATDAWHMRFESADRTRGWTLFAE